MANGWTPERRAKQASTIQSWKPWEKSTGAKTQEGKSTSSKNALKHGIYSSASLAMRKAINELLIVFKKKNLKL